MKNITSSALLGLSLLLAHQAHAKIGDPIPVLYGNAVIISHAHQVTAYEQKEARDLHYCQKHPCKEIWTATVDLPEYRSENFSPNMETDNRWCTIQALSIKNKKLEVLGCDSKVFILNPKNGKTISSRHS